MKVATEEAKQKATEERVSHLLEFRAEDGTQTDISKATVVTLYMFKWFNNAIRSKLQKLKPGSRIVAHDYDIDDWKPTRVVNLEPGKDPDIERLHTSIYGRSTWRQPRHKTAVISLLPPQPMERRPMALHARRRLSRARRSLLRIRRASADTQVCFCGRGECRRILPDEILHAQRLLPR